MKVRKICQKALNKSLSQKPRALPQFFGQNQWLLFGSYEEIYKLHVAETGFLESPPFVCKVRAHGLFSFLISKIHVVTCYHITTRDFWEPYRFVSHPFQLKMLASSLVTLTFKACMFELKYIRIKCIEFMP